MSRLSPTEYVRRHRAKQKQTLIDQQIEIARLQSEIQRLRQAIQPAYRQLDIFEEALTRALGRPYTMDDFSHYAPTGRLSRHLRMLSGLSDPDQNT